MTSPCPGRLPDVGRPAASQTSTVWFLSVRWGAFGQPASNRFSRYTVSLSFAPRRRSRYRAWIAASRLARKRVPIQAPAAPNAKAAARPRPSAMPPAATTGVGETASTTAGMRGIVATVPRTCPPASHPCATTISTPQSTARLASAAEPTVCITMAFTAFCKRNQSRGVLPEKGNDRDALFEADCEALLLREIQVQVDAEGPRRQRAHLVDLPPASPPRSRAKAPACRARPHC